MAGSLNHVGPGLVSDALSNPLEGTVEAAPAWSRLAKLQPLDRYFDVISLDVVAVTNQHQVLERTALPVGLRRVGTAVRRLPPPRYGRPATNAPSVLTRMWSQPLVGADVSRESEDAANRLTFGLETRALRCSHAAASYRKQGPLSRSVNA